MLPRSPYSQCKAPNAHWERSSAGTPFAGRRNSIQLTLVDRRVSTCSRNSKARRYELKLLRTFMAYCCHYNLWSLTNLIYTRNPP